MKTFKILVFLLLALLSGSLLLAPALVAQERPEPRHLTSPQEALGFNLGDDDSLASYRQLAAWWKKLARESDRMRLTVIGKTEEGREMLMAVVTSKANQRRLGRLKEISSKLALARGLSDREAHALAREGCAVVWIDGGLHASETLGAQQLMRTLYEMLSQSDAETLFFLDHLVLLFCNPNPDGQDLVADWYMRKKDKKKRSLRYLPRLYQKYIGHDNNRDFYMASQKETQALCHVFFEEWFPQIVYNHHQSGPPGTVLFAPPFRDPQNYNLDPLVRTGIQLVGAAMHQRFLVEGKRGATMRRGTSYSTWWNGGLRTSACFHNMLGLLTETIGGPTPSKIPLRLKRQISSGDLPAPIAPQDWHFRQSMDYVVSANRAVMDVAARHKEQFLFNIYRMGKNSIERGSRDHWTIWPDRLEAAKKAAAEWKKKGKPLRDLYREVLHDPTHRDPRGYIIPADQPDFLTAVKFVNALQRNGIQVLRATRTFQVGGQAYPAGSFIVSCAQAFRPHILDMFEPQIYPDDLPYQGGPPTPPYDSAGYTLAFQMGVVFKRILEGFAGPFEVVRGLARPPQGEIKKAAGAAGFLFSHRTNDAFKAMNLLLRSSHEVRWLTKPLTVAGRVFEAGTIYVPGGPGTLSRLRQLSRGLGLSFTGLKEPPKVPSLKMRLPRIGLLDRYGGSMASGWLRWLLERFGFSFKLVYPPDLDAGGLRQKYDVLIFPRGAIPDPRRFGKGSPGQVRRRRGRGGLPKPDEIPKTYRGRLGRFSREKTLPRLKEFLSEGGTICALGSSTALAWQLELSLRDQLLETRPDGTQAPLPRSRFFVPGSILEVHLNTEEPLAWGLPARLLIDFRRSPVFRLEPDVREHGLHPVAWFASKQPLRSGWALGQELLEDGVVVIDARVGQGSLFLFTPGITFRGQPHASFKLLWNALYLGPARAGF